MMMTSRSTMLGGAVLLLFCAMTTTATGPLPPDLVEVILRSIPDPKPVLMFGLTSRESWRIAAPLVERLRRAQSLFLPMTPTHQLPELIRYLAEATDLRLFTSLITFHDAVFLFDRLRSVTSPDHLFNLTPFTPPPRPADSPSFAGTLIIQLVTLLVRDVHETVFSNAAAVFILPTACLTNPDPILDLIPAPPSSIPAQIQHAVSQLVDKYALNTWVSDVIQNHHSRCQYPPPFNQVFPWNDYIADDLLEDPDVLAILSQNTTGLLSALLSVGIRFDIKFLDKIDVSPAEIGVVFPLLAVKDLGLTLMQLATYSERRMDQHARALLRTPAYRSLMAQYPAEFEKVMAELIEDAALMAAIRQMTPRS